MTTPAERHAISADGTPIAYWTSGTGPPLVLVHGVSADHLSWERLRPHLESRVTVHAIDRRGRMGSGDGPAYRTELEGEDVACVVERVATDRCVVFGHSFGGTAAILATGRTDRVSDLILYEPALRADAEVLSAAVVATLRRLHESDDREALLRFFYSAVVGMSADEVAFFASLPTWAARVAAAHTLIRESDFDVDLDAACRSIRIPTRLIVGTDSPDFIREDAFRALRTIPGATLTELDGQAHIAHYTDPEGLAAAILADDVRS